MANRWCGSFVRQSSRAFREMAEAAIAELNIIGVQGNELGAAESAGKAEK
jgi:hypothetical protein